MSRASGTRYVCLPCLTLPLRPPSCPIPPAEEAAGEAFSLTSLSSQLKQLGSKLQSASASGRQRAGLELSNLVSSVRGERGSPGPEAAAAASSSPGAEAGGGAAGGAAGAAAAGAAGAASAAAAAAGEAKAAPPAGMLEEDPDLEAYLQVWWGTGACAGVLQGARCCGHACRGWLSCAFSLLLPLSLLPSNPLTQFLPSALGPSPCPSR